LFGIGLKVEQKSDGSTIIAKIKPGSNAHMAGVFREGDQVMAIGEDSAKGQR
jgi:C-terminal processing protease CtpA/Prc